LDRQRAWCFAAPATIAIARHQLGLDQPLLQRYWTWLTNILTGNFGTSTTGQPVGPELWSRLGITLRMVIPSVIIAAFIAVIIGVVTAVRQYSILDHTLTGFAYLFYSAPVFVIAILLKELRVLGSFTYADEFAEVIALLADGALQVADLTSEIASIDGAPAAFERLRDANTMKILIAPNGP